MSFPARPTSEAADIITSSDACETPFQYSKIELREPQERHHVVILNIFLMKIINADSFRTILFDYCMNGLDQSYSKVKLVFRQLNRLH